MINEDEQVFFTGNYEERINSPIITTGNELVKQQIADFSKQLNLDELYSYISAVKYIEQHLHISAVILLHSMFCKPA